jgi:hypothetical protein
MKSSADHIFKIQRRCTHISSLQKPGWSSCSSELFPGVDPRWIRTVTISHPTFIAYRTILHLSPMCLLISYWTLLFPNRTCLHWSQFWCICYARRILSRFLLHLKIPPTKCRLMRASWTRPPRLDFHVTWCCGLFRLGESGRFLGHYANRTWQVFGLHDPTHHH